MKLVETPPGPPVIASVVAEVYGQPDHRYEDILLAADTVRARLAVEPGVVDVDHVREAAQQKITFVTDKEKAALNGITTEQIAGTLQALLDSDTVGLVRSETERNPLRIELRRPRGSPDQRGRLGEGSGQRQQWPTGSLGRARSMGNGPRGPDDLPQELAASGLRVCRNSRPPARGCGRGHSGR